VGKVTITGGAVEALGITGEHAIAFLLRHVRGDWGVYGNHDETQLTPDERHRGSDTTDESGKINKSDLLNRRDRVMSEYQTHRGKQLWVITALDGAGGTTILLPEEY
jgi:hypothetical protein